MEESPILSICVPTFNRGALLHECLQNIISYKGNEVEVIVSDNASTDETENIVLSFKDSRLRYSRNKINVGYDKNILRCIELARGMFVFFLSDEDIIEITSIDKIINEIKQNHRVSMVMCSIGDRRPGFPRYYLSVPRRQVLKRGSEAMINHFLLNSYLSGSILKIEGLDKSAARKYVGFSYMQQVLAAQAMMHGDLLMLPIVSCSIGDKSSKTTIIMKQVDDNKQEYAPYYDPVNRITQIRYRLRLLNELPSITGYTKKIIRKRELRFFASLLTIDGAFTRRRKILPSFLRFIKIMPRILQIREIRASSIFWINVIYHFMRLIPGIEQINFGKKLFKK